MGELMGILASPAVVADGHFSVFLVLLGYSQWYTQCAYIAYRGTLRVKLAFGVLTLHGDPTRVFQYSR